MRVVLLARRIGAENCAVINEECCLFHIFCAIALLLVIFDDFSHDNETFVNVWSLQKNDHSDNLITNSYEEVLRLTNNGWYEISFLSSLFRLSALITRICAMDLLDPLISV